MAARALVLVLLLSGCGVIEQAETAALNRARHPIVVPLLKGSFPPLCIHSPILFWEKPTCA